MVAVSEQISAHVSAGLLLVSGGQDSSQQGKTKRRKKHEDAEVQKLIEQPSEPQPSEPEHSDNQLPPEPESDDVINLVAEPEHENWVSSTENIVGLPTTDEI